MTRLENVDPLGLSYKFRVNFYGISREKTVTEMS
jgi:hypothetical protein